MTVSEAFESYRQNIIIFGDKSPKTEEAYNCALVSILKFTGSDLLLQDLTLDLVKDWKSNLKSPTKSRPNGLAPRTIRGYILCLRVVLAYERSRGVLCLDPDHIPIPPRIERSPSVITALEVSKLLSLVEMTPNCSHLIKCRNKAIISLLYGSGLRISELCSLNRDDVKRNVFTVIGKLQKPGMCQLDGRTRIFIDQYLSLRTDGHEALFLDNNKQERLSANSIQHLFRRLSTAGEFKKAIHPHTLRHSYATNLLINGCHIYTLSRLMRHTSIATTQIYLHHHDSELIEAYQKFHST